MILSLSNNHFQFKVDLAQATWQLAGGRNLAASLQGISSAITYRRGGKSLRDLVQWRAPKITDPVTVNSPQGPLRQLQIAIGPEEGGLGYTFSFALSEHHPIFLWKLAVKNHGYGEIHIDQIELLRIRPPSGKIVLSGTPGTAKPTPNWAFFSNGWQSWSYSGVYGPADRYRASRLGPFHLPLRVNAGTPFPKKAGVFASDMFGVLGDRNSRIAVLAGFLSQCQHFGSLKADIRSPRPALHMWANGDGARLDPGMEMITDWACLSFVEIDDPDPLAPYLDAVARQHNLPYISALAEHTTSALHNQGIPTGWCSWYHYFQEVTAVDIERNLDAAVNLEPNLPLKLIQIDDGFEGQVGDWLSFSPAFPEGVAQLADKIKAAGKLPGLWLAPFILHRKSRLARKHPDWLLRGHFGRPVNAGFIWNTFTTALDLTHPEALKYAADVVGAAAHRWGFPYLKLDFLYAAALPGRYRDPTQTRAQVLRHGLKVLRAAAGNETTLLGCGCPIGSAIGLVEAMRIGADVDPHWSPHYTGIDFFFRGEPDMPATRNAIQNTLTRAPYHRRWWVNDPDCLLLGPETDLTQDEIRSWASLIALSGGSLLISDDLTALPAGRLNIAKVLFPLIGRAPRILDWFDASMPCRLRLDLDNCTGTWHLLALFNWQDRPVDLQLDLGEFDLAPVTSYYASRFWNEQIFLVDNEGVTFNQVPAHGVVLLALRDGNCEASQLVGSNLHISQGLEVVEWIHKENSVELQLERPGAAQGYLTLKLPKPPMQAALDGHSIAWTEPIAGCYRFSLEFFLNAKLQIDL